MSTIHVQINNARVTALDNEKAEKTRTALHGIATTQNIDAKTVKSALEFLGVDFPKAFLAGGKPSDVVVIFENEKPAAEYTRQNLYNRMIDSLSGDKRTGKIFTSTKGEKSGSVPQEVVTGW